MFTRLAEFRLAQSRRTAPGLREALTHCNDNLPGLRRSAAAGRRWSPTPTLARHWFDRNGRLECRWQVETSEDASIADARGTEPSELRRLRGSFAQATMGSERCPDATSFSEKAIGHSRTGFGCGHATFLHRSPCRGLQNPALTVGA